MNLQINECFHVDLQQLMVSAAGAGEIKQEIKQKHVITLIPPSAKCDRIMSVCRWWMNIQMWSPWKPKLNIDLMFYTLSTCDLTLVCGNTSVKIKTHKPSDHQSSTSLSGLQHSSRDASMFGPTVADCRHHRLCSGLQGPNVAVRLCLNNQWTLNLNDSGSASIKSPAVTGGRL